MGKLEKINYDDNNLGIGDTWRDFVRKINLLIDRLNEEDDIIKCNYFISSNTGLTCDNCGEHQSKHLIK